MAIGNQAADDVRPVGRGQQEQVDGVVARNELRYFCGKRSPRYACVAPRRHRDTTSG